MPEKIIIKLPKRPDFYDRLWVKQHLNDKPYLFAEMRNKRGENKDFYFTSMMGALKYKSLLFH